MKQAGRSRCWNQDCHGNWKISLKWRFLCYEIVGASWAESEILLSQTASLNVFNRKVSQIRLQLKARPKT